MNEWESIVEEINKFFRDIHFIDEKLGVEMFYAGHLKHYKFKYDPLQKLPALRFKKHPRYGYELYLEFFINQDLQQDGVKTLIRKRLRISGDLNNIANSEQLHSYAIRLAFSVYLKIKAGYYIKYIPNIKSMKFSEVEKLTIGKHFLIPTLHSYLEHFYEVRSIKKGLYGTIKSDLNTLTKFIYKLPRRLPVDLTKLDHSVKFLEFDRIYAIKFKEYLQSNKDTKSGEVISGITVKNIFSSLVNLVNKICEKRGDLQRMSYINPFSRPNIEKSKPKMHVTLTPKQLKNLGSIMKETGDTQLLLFVDFLYLTGIRPIEAKRLRVKHLVDFRNALNLTADITKNGLPRSIPTNNYFHSLIKAMNLEAYPEDYFLFSRNGGVGLVKTGQNYFSRKFKEIRLKCKDITPLHTLYSYRHTFALNFMMEPQKGQSNENRRFELMKRLGHSEFETTQKYLRGLPEELVGKSSWKGMKHWSEK